MSLHRIFLSSENFYENARLTLIYNKLSTQLNYEYFHDFLSNIFNLNDQIILERFIFLLNNNQNKQKYTLKDFHFIMNFFLSLSIDEQMKFIFRIYDISADGNLQREEIFTFLRKDLKINDENDDIDMILHEFINLIFKKFDKDQDGMISFEDYSRTCQENPTLIECFGQILPNFIRKYVIKIILNGNRSIFEKNNFK